MIAGKFLLARATGLWWLAASAVFAENFAPPAEGPVAFRRDRIPLDSEMLADFSRQLVTLAEALDGKTAVSRRGAAQMLALALATDPGNAKARDLIAEFAAERQPAAGDSPEIGKCQTRLWEWLAWLEAPEAGDQARALAACVTDVLLISDPNHPRAESLRSSMEHGAWKNWIPDLKAYEPPVVEKIDPTPPPDIPAIAQSGIKLDKARVLVPLWRTAGAANWALAPAPLLMTAKTTEAGENGPPPFSLTIGPANNNPLEALSQPILKLLAKQHGNLPAGGSITVDSPALETSLQSTKKQSISAAVAVLASSAISGQEPDAMIIGTIDASGAFKLPAGFWDQLQSLGPGNGGRLILPAAAATYLPSLLALERYRIFFDYEILLAANFQELLDLSAKTSAEPLAKSSALFREIREKAGNQSLGPYLANPFIRRRFAEIAQATPCHYSAKMLALQGAGNRPGSIPKMVLTAELRRAIEPMDWIIRHQNDSFQDSDTATLDATADACKTKLDSLARYTESNDRPLLEQARDAVGEIRTLMRAIRSKGENNVVKAAIMSAHSRLVRAQEDLLAELVRHSGEPTP